MSTAQPDVQTPQKPLRLWPGIVLVILQWIGWLVVPMIARDAAIFAVLGALACGVFVLVWWLFFSRAPWVNRIGALVLMVIAIILTKRIVHQSLANGMMGLLVFVYAIPALSLAVVIGAVASSRLSGWAGRVAMVAAIILTCAVFLFLRTGGITGYADSDFHWRWSRTPEERLLAQGDEPTATAAALVSATATEKGVDWPGFRGPERDGVVHGVRIKTNWTGSPPVELWRRPVGPGWSSFAISGDLLYTQEQRGDDELVSCYNVITGKPIWRHRDATRFWESNAGAGPRGTPTLSHGHVYTFGGTGIVNALDASNGSVVWTRNAASDTSTRIPGWGFSSSPLVIDNLVIVAAAGKLVAYDLNTGEPRWQGPDGGGGYSSPQRVTLDGVTQVILMCGPGTISVAPADGKLLWQHPLSSNTRIVQPGVMPEGDLLVSDGEGNNMHRIAVAHGAGGWTVQERWTSEGLKPYFNDFVVHNGYAYGFDGGVIACIDLKDGSLKWKGGRYGHGQLVLLQDQNLLLVLSEEGELALVGATPDQFTELARLKAIEGKTWNHPVVVRDVVLARNGQEMVAYRLPLESR